MKLKRKKQQCVAALMAVALGSTSILGMGVSAEDLHVGVGVDAGLLDGSEGTGDGISISLDADAVEDTEAEEAAGLTEEAVTPEAVAESLAGLGLVWTDATDEAPGTKIITVEKKDGSGFAEGEELVVGGLNEDDLGIEDIMYIAAEEQAYSLYQGFYEAGDGKDFLENYAEFQVIRPYICDADGAISPTTDEMEMTVIFTDEQKKEFLSEGSLELSVIPMDADYNMKGMEYEVDTDDAKLYIDGGMDYLCLAWSWTGEHGELTLGDNEGTQNSETDLTIGEKDEDTISIWNENDGDALSIEDETTEVIEPQNTADDNAEQAIDNTDELTIWDNESVSIETNEADELSVPDVEENDDDALSIGTAEVSEENDNNDDLAIGINELYGEGTQQASSIDEAMAGLDLTLNAIEEAESETVANEDTENAPEDEMNESEESQDDISVDVPETETESMETEIETESEPVIAENDGEAETESLEPEDMETEESIEVAPIQKAPEQEPESQDTEILTSLNREDFLTARLVVITDEGELGIYQENIIAQYGDIYLIQFETIDEAMAAYVYYLDNADAVEPDAAVQAAEDTDLSIDGSNAQESTQTDSRVDTDTVAPSEVAEFQVTEETNPLTSLAEEPAMNTEEVSIEKPLIALIDTGTEDGPNIVGRVSMIDDALVGNGHGDDMASYIIGQNPDAQIMSIRALDDNGKGTVSSIVAAIEYAIEQKVDIINLSLYSRLGIANSALVSEMQKAIDAGITVVGAAGNDGRDASKYVPGCVKDAYIIGACEEGTATRLPSSNFGYRVDYYVQANSTSEAAAKFTGYISLHGTDISADDIMAITDPEEPSKLYVSLEPNTASQTTLLTYIMNAYGKSRFIKNAKDTGFIEMYGLTDEDYEYCAELEATYWDNKDLNDYLDSVEKQEASEAGAEYDKYPDYIWDGEASLFGIVANGASIKVGSNGIYNIMLLEGDMATLTEDSGLTTAQEDITGTWGENIPIGGTTCSYAWDVQMDGTILLYFFNAEDVSGMSLDNVLATDFFTIKLIPESATISSAEFEGMIFGSVDPADPWNKWSGTETYADALDFDGDTYLKWLSDHHPDTAVAGYGKTKAENQKYYVGTPYPSYGSYAFPNGDCPSGQTPQMNCTAFVWHVLWMAMQQSGNANSPDAYQIGSGYSTAAQGRYYTFEGWTVRPRQLGIKRIYVKTKKDLFNVGKPNKGDIIWIMAEGEDTTGKPGADNHIGIYWGDGTTDVFWHSTHASSITIPKASGSGTISKTGIWCDGTENSSKYPYGHIIAGDDVIDGNSDSIIQSNVTTEVASKQVKTFGYILYRVTDKPPTGITIKKKLRDSAFSSYTDRIKIDTYYTIFKNSSCTQKERTIHIKGDTKYDGTASVSITIDPGTYYIRETKSDGSYKETNDDGTIKYTARCIGCIVDTHTYKFTVEEGDSGKPTFYDIDNGNSTSTVLYNTPCRFQGKIATKVNKTNNEPLQGAIFKLTYTENHPTDSTEPDGAGHTYTFYLQSDEKGEVKYDKDHIVWDYNGNKSDEQMKLSNGEWALPPGYITIEEVKAPDGFKLVPDDENKIIKSMWPKQDDTGTYSIKDMTINAPTFSNVEENWKVQVYTKKRSSLTAEELADNPNYTIKGAQFGVYADESCTPGTELCTLTSGEDGVTNVYEHTVPDSQSSITLWCRETKAPEGHKLSDEVKSVTFAKPSDITQIQSQSFGGDWGFTNDPDETTITIKKVQVDGTWDDALNGAEFSLYDDMGNYLESITIKNGGTFEFKQQCKKGESYTIKETRTPAGYITADPITITITQTDEPNTFTFINDMTPPKVYIQKLTTVLPDVLALRGYSLKDAEFGVYEDANCETEPIAVLKTDENGTTQEFELPCKTAGTYTYYVKELTAPKGHYLNTEIKPVTFSLPHDADTTRKVDMADEPQYTNIGLFMEKKDHKGNPVPGVIVSMTYYDAEGEDTSKEHRTWYFMSKADGTIEFDEEKCNKPTIQYGYQSDEFYRDKDGYIQLPVGGYIVVKEVAAPAEYVVDKDAKFTWSTAVEQLSESLEIERKVMYDTLQPVKIRIQKYDENGKSPLEGVTFRLEFLEESIPYNAPEAALSTKPYEPLLKVGESIEMTTGANGLALFENLDQGRYRISEIATAEGHSLLKDTIEVTLPLVMSLEEAAKIGKIDEDKAIIGYDDNQYYFFEVGYDITNGIVVNLMTGGSGSFTLGYVGIAAVAALGIWLTIMEARRRKSNLKI